MNIVEMKNKAKRIRIIAGMLEDNLDRYEAVKDSVDIADEISETIEIELRRLAIRVVELKAAYDDEEEA